MCTLSHIFQLYISVRGLYICLFSSICARSNDDWWCRVQRGVQWEGYLLHQRRGAGERLGCPSTRTRQRMQIHHTQRCTRAEACRQTLSSGYKPSITNPPKAWRLTQMNSWTIRIYQRNLKRLSEVLNGLSWKVPHLWHQQLLFVCLVPRCCHIHAHHDHTLYSWKRMHIPALPHSNHSTRMSYFTHTQTRAYMHHFVSAHSLFLRTQMRSYMHHLAERTPCSSNHTLTYLYRLAGVALLA